MTNASARTVAFVLAVLGVAACSAGESTAPKRLLVPVSAMRDIGDSIPDASCRSGYTNPNGHCIDP